MGNFRKLIYFLIVALFFSCGALVFAQVPSISPHQLQTIEKKYGPNAVKRINAWLSLIKNSEKLPELAQLKVVNSFFNQLEYRRDMPTLGVDDYWMTPLEFLSRGGGECKDYSIGKYFTLLALGVAMEKLQITYAKALRYNEAHMVLAYYKTPDAEPLILDNLTSEILPANKRSDLLPIYSFNGEGLWLAQQRGQGQYVGTSTRIGKWQDVIRKMAAEQAE